MNSDDPSTETASNNGFMNGFKEIYVECPPNQQNGNCIVFYGDEHKNCVMKVSLANGKREGEALVLRNKVPLMKLKYVNGILMGTVERLNREGTVEMRGQLVNGKEWGLFEEYNANGMICWRGYYRNGKRYSEVVPNAIQNGFYDERRVTDGKLLTTAMYDDSLHHKNGYCVEYTNGELSECYYENGVKCKESGNENAIGSSLTSALHLSPLVDPFDENTLIVSYLGTESVFAVSLTNQKVIMVKDNHRIQADLNSYKLYVYEENEMKKRLVSTESGFKSDANGRRWEGGVKNGMPMGYGVLYDEKGRKLYEGFRMKNDACCYGKEYYPDSGNVYYEGCYCNGKRFGRGIVYDRNGKTAYDGFFRENVTYSPQFDGNTISNRTELITIANRSYCDITTLLLPSWLCFLKRIEIGSDCFSSIRCFNVDGLEVLESITIGERSFTMAKEEGAIFNSTRKDGTCRIVNCPKLQSIRFGSYSFADYRQRFEVNGLPSLQSVVMGDKCFSFTSLFSMMGLNWKLHRYVDLAQLRFIDLGGNTFNGCQTVVFSSKRMGGLTN